MSTGAITTIRAALTWDDIRSMAPGGRRDGLVYAYRQRQANLRARGLLAANDWTFTHDEADTIRLAAIRRWHDTPGAQAGRRAELAAATTQRAAA